MSEKDSNSMSESKEDKNSISEEDINDNIIEKDMNNISEEKKKILKECLKEYQDVKDRTIIIVIQ